MGNGTIKITKPDLVGLCGPEKLVFNISNLVCVSLENDIITLDISEKQYSFYYDRFDIDNDRVGCKKFIQRVYDKLSNLMSTIDHDAEI